MNVPIRRGGVYWIPDTAAALPPKTLKDRTIHPRRPFLVISDDNQNMDASWPIVLGFPFTTSGEFSTGFDVDVKQGDGGLPSECTVRVVLAQPLAKTKLDEYLGQLSANKVEECMARLLDYTGALNI